MGESDGKGGAAESGTPNLDSSEPVKRHTYDEIIPLLTEQFDARVDRGEGQLPETDDEGIFYWDIDGFVDPTRQGPESRFTRIGADASSVDWAEIGTLHYLLRSSAVLNVKAPPDAWTAYQDFSKSCLREAARILGNRLPLPKPVWVDGFLKIARESPSVSREVLDSLTISTNLRPQIMAFSYPKDSRIIISAVARDHLRTVNLALLTITESILIRKERKDGVEFGRNFVDLILPSLFALYFPRVNHSKLPILRTPNGRTLRRACQLADSQVHFMLAHELAHLQLHQGKPKTVETEQEADKFAYDLLFDYASTEAGGGSHTLFIACRWLFLYLALDRIIGATLSGYDIDWVELPIRDRELPLYRAIKSIKGSFMEVHQAPLGDLLMFQAKHALADRGSDWIKQQAKIFQREFCDRRDLR